MLGLVLREEFKGKRLKGTLVELTNKSNTGATQIHAPDFLRITYPSGDVLKAIEAIQPKQGRPAVLIGERGLGKSHIMATIFHALTDTAATREWLEFWAKKTGNAKIAELELREGMHVITESLHRQSFKHLWDLLFERHPSGSWAQGKWEGMGSKKTDVPPYELLLELFEKQPTALILDEYQTWFDGLTNTKQYPWRAWAFNFIQILSETARERPDLLTLVVSVRNGDSDAFQQVQRVNPILIDFKGPNTKRDRQRLLLHRLFENRMQVGDETIRHIIDSHVGEFFRLKEISLADYDRHWQDFVEAWPFAPHLMQLLEDQVLEATHTQETRDLIRILVDLYKRQTDEACVITAADFRLDETNTSIEALLDSVSNQHHAKLREKSQRNQEAVSEAVENASHVVPHLTEIIGALWVRSLAMSNQAGADATTLQVDITGSKPIDDNAFKVELDTIVENSFNIHLEGERLIFKEEENPQARLIASARNDKQFTDGSDLEQLAREIRYVLAGDGNVARAFHVMVLPQNWENEPWDSLDENDRPDNWDDRIPLCVLPETPRKLDATLGKWLKTHVQEGRNTVRFLVPREGTTNAFNDKNLVILARAVLLANRWKKDNPEYAKLHRKYEGELRNIIKVRSDRFTVLDTWNFGDPSRCTFQTFAHKSEGSKIPDAIDKYVQENLFIPEDFEALVKLYAQSNDTVAKLLKELQEPRPNELACIPWLGETLVKEKLIRLITQGKIAINLRGMEYLQLKDGESEDTAWKRMRGKIGTGKHLSETHILLPEAVPATGGSAGTGTTGGGDGSGTGEDGGLFGGDGGHGGGSEPGTKVGEGAGTYGGDTGSGAATDDGSIFGGGLRTTKQYVAPPTSSLNLLQQLELWQINPGTDVQDLNLHVDKLTGAQLDRLIQALPDGMTYELRLQKEE